MALLNMPRLPSLPSTSTETRRRWLAALAMGLIAVVTLVVSLAATPDAIWYPLFGTDAGISPVDPANLQLVWPTVGHVVAWAPTWLAGAAATLLTFALLRHLGCNLLAATAAALALSSSASIWGRISADEPVVTAVLFFLGTTGGLLVWRDSRRTLPLIVAAVAYALAVVGHPAALGALPAVMWMVAPSIVALAAMTTGAAVGAAGLWWTMGSGTSPVDWFAPDALGTIGARVGEVAGMVVGDFGILGVALLAIGCVRLAARFDRFVLLVGGAAGVGAWALVWGAPAWQNSLLLAFAPLWLLVGVGMQWAGTLVETKSARLGVAALIVLLPAMSLTAHFDIGAGARGATLFTDQYLDQLEAVVPPGAVVLAEGGLLGRRLAEHARRQPEAAFGRIPQTPLAVTQALLESRPVVGFANARENLRALGFRFETIDSSGVLMTVREFLETVPDGWLVAVAAGHEFFRRIPPNEGPTFGAIGGTQDLFGKSRWHYSLIGVKGSDQALLERSEAGEVEVSVRGAESITPFVRSPGALRARSLGEATIVEYLGDQVAYSEHGIALAVISPSGTFAAAYDADLSQNRGITVNPTTLLPGLVTGREPCVDTQPGLWTDVSDIAGRASLGTLTDPGQDLTVYVAADHPLTPRATRLRRPTTATLDVTAFATASETRLSALRDLLRVDGLDTRAPEIEGQPYVYRIHADAAQTGRQQIALELGGFPTLALARAGVGPTATPLTLCSAMSSPVDPDVDLGRHDLFVFGWAEVERGGGSRFRWTRAPRAELLLPLDRAERITVAIAARPIAGQGTTLTLQVNETVFAPVVMDAAQREYRWEVPAESWRAGMNRVWLGVSDRARPADFDGSSDTRLLGLAVRQIRLTPQAAEPGPSGGR